MIGSIIGRETGINLRKAESLSGGADNGSITGPASLRPRGLELGMGLRPVELLEEGVDCVVRLGEQADSSLVARRVGTMTSVCCASPAYLREHDCR
jgi:hypothetical protein